MMSREDVALIRAAASLAAHVPERMHAGHLAARLERLASRLALVAETAEPEGARAPRELPRAA